MQPISFPTLPGSKGRQKEEGNQGVQAYELVPRRDEGEQV